MNMAAPDIGACVSAGVAGLKKNPLAHIVGNVLVMVVGGVSAGLLTGPMLVGYMRMVKAEDEGREIEFTDVFKGFDDLVPALLRCCCRASSSRSDSCCVLCRAC